MTIAAGNGVRCSTLTGGPMRPYDEDVLLLATGTKSSRAKAAPTRCSRGRGDFFCPEVRPSRSVRPGLTAVIAAETGSTPDRAPSKSTGFREHAGVGWTLAGTDCHPPDARVARFWIGQEASPMRSRGRLAFRPGSAIPIGVDSLEHRQLLSGIAHVAAGEVGLPLAVEGRAGAADAASSAARAPSPWSSRARPRPSRRHPRGTRLLVT